MFMQELQRKTNTLPRVAQPNMGYVASSLFNQGGDNLSSGLKDVSNTLGEQREAKRQQKLAQVLLNTDRGEVEDLYDYQRRGAKALLLSGANPEEASTMMKLKTAPYIAQRDYANKRADTLFNQGIETGKLQTKTATQPKTGETYTFNPETGKYDIPLYEGIDPLKVAQAKANGNNTVMVDKTVPDGFGGSTTIKVPVNKYTGKDAEGNTPKVVKQATLSQKDKDFTKNYGSGSDVIKTVYDYLEPKHSGIWGGLDSLTGPIGKFFGSTEGENQALAQQALENLRLEATNKLSGVLSDQDMKIILDTIPTINDQPELAKAKLQKVETAIAKADANQFNRLVKSNPNAVKDMAIGMVKGTTPVPTGYQLVKYKDGSVALIPK